MAVQKLKPKRDLTGKQFGRLTVIGFNSYKEKHNRRKDFWNVKCSCGNEKILHGNVMVSGGVLSCGCLLKERYAELGEITRKRNSLPKGEAALNTLFANYKLRAINKELQFNLTKQEFKTLVIENCEYCGSEPNNLMKKKTMNGGMVYNGIDRVDNSLGYVKSNCITACEICNKAKRDLTIEEFITWIQRITQSNSWKKLIKVKN